MGTAIEIEQTMHGRVQKPIRSERGGGRPRDPDGFALRRCCVCGHKTTLFCRKAYLCCQRSCDHRHLKRCRPVKRDVMTYP